MRNSYSNLVDTALCRYQHESTTLKFKADEDTSMNQPL